MSTPNSTNYQLLGNVKKPEVKLNLDKLEPVKKEILKILKEDKKYWKDQKLKQQGIEKYNLIKKVCVNYPTNMRIFEIALDILETEQHLLSFSTEGYTRYILFGGVL